MFSGRESTTATMAFIPIPGVCPGKQTLADDAQTDHGRYQGHNFPVPDRVYNRTTVCVGPGHLLWLSAVLQ